MADQGSEGILSPYLRKQRFKVSIPYLRGKILDVGCGSGMLAKKVLPDLYMGIEIDPTSLKIAISDFPAYRFSNTLPDELEKFDTIISLAVIEHVKNPVFLLAELSKRLKRDESSRVVITTPHPSMDWVHDLGSSIGLFSQHANEEHEELLDRDKLESVGNDANLQLVHYKRFLFGANQLAVYKHRV